MNFRDIQYILALADHQNFTRAAEAVAVSQPALSNQIKKIEQQFGVSLFKRGRNGVHLTAFGREILEDAKRVVELVEGISEIAKKHRNPQNLPLRLGMTPTLAAYLSRYFREVFAQIALGRIIMMVEEYPVALAKMVEEKTIDVAFIARNSFDTISKGHGHSSVFTSLWLEPLYLGVRLGHPLTKNSSIWAHEVPQDQLIRFDISFGYDLERYLPTPSEANEQALGIDVKTARFETVCRHVAQSDACTMINSIAAEQFKRDDFGLAFIPFNDAGNIRELGVLSRSDYGAPELIDGLRDAISADPPHGTAASRNEKLVQTTTAAHSPSL